MWSGRQYEPRQNIVDLDKLHVRGAADLSNHEKKIVVDVIRDSYKNELSPKMRTTTMPRGASIDNIGGVGGFPKFVLIGT